MFTSQFGGLASRGSLVSRLGSTVAAVALLALPLTALAVPVHAGAAAPTQPCGEGGYYGGGDEIPPDSGGVYGALLVAAPSSAKAVDTDHDRWICRGPGVLRDNRGLIPRPRPYARGEQITSGDVMGPPIGDGMCCDGSKAIDLRENTLHAAGYTEKTLSRFDSSRIFRWDKNDIFYVDGTHVTMAAFERSLTEGDLFTAVYAARASGRSVWSFYNHEV